MADVYRALSGLSRTMRDRGGYADALLKGADANMGMRRMEYEIGRGVKADKRAEEEWGLKKPGLERQAAEDAYLNEAIPITAREVFPRDASGVAAAVTPDKDGQSNYDIINSMLPGSGWDEAGNRIDKSGKPVTVPRWKWEQRFKPGLMMTYIARTDPVRKLDDEEWNTRKKISEMVEGSPEHVAERQKLDAITKAKGDKKTLASLYARQAAAVNESLAWAVSTGADSKFIALLDREVQRTEGKFNQHAGTEKGDLELEQLRQQIETSKAQRQKYLAEAAKAGRGDITTYQSARLKAEAFKILNGELESMSLSPQWTRMKPEEQAAWKQNRLTEIMQTIRPTSTMGLGGDQAGPARTQGQFKVGEIRLAPEGTKGAGKYWQYGQDGQWTEVPGPGAAKSDKTLSPAESKKFGSIKSGLAGKQEPEYAPTETPIEGFNVIGGVPGRGPQKDVNLGEVARKVGSKLKKKLDTAAEQTSRQFMGGGRKIKDLNLPESDIKTLIRVYGKDVLERDASEIAKLLEGK